MDVMGPMAVKSMAGNKYVLFIMDNETEVMWIKFMKLKSQVHKVHKEFIEEHVKYHRGTAEGIRLMTNNAKELRCGGLLQFSRDDGIIR